MLRQPTKIRTYPKCEAYEILKGIFNNTLKYAYIISIIKNIHTSELIFHTFSLAAEKTKRVHRIEHYYKFEIV